MEERKRLRRSRNKVAAGVCGGIAEYFDLSASNLRIAFVILALLGGLSLWIYLGMWIIIPKKDNN